MFSKTANMLSVQECQFSETANCLCSLGLRNVFLEHLHHTCCRNVPTYNSWMSTGAPTSGKKQQWQIILERECSCQEILNVGGVTTYPKTNCNEFRKKFPIESGASVYRESRRCLKVKIAGNRPTPSPPPPPRWTNSTYQDLRKNPLLASCSDGHFWHLY